MTSTEATEQAPNPTLTIILDEQLRKEIAEVAAKNDRSLGAEVRVAMRDHITRENGKVS